MKILAIILLLISIFKFYLTTKDFSSYVNESDFEVLDPEQGITITKGFISIDAVASLFCALFILFG